MLTEIHYHFHHKFRGNFTRIIINLQNDLKQECIPVGCVPPARWPHPVVSNGGVCPTRPMQTHLDADPPGQNAYVNITLPQTSLAGGKNSAQWEAGELFLSVRRQGTHFPRTKIELSDECS